MNRLAILLLCHTSTLYLSANDCSARLGDTESEIEARYGKPVSRLKPPVPMVEKSNSYDFRGMKISIFFIGGKSVFESYHPMSTTPLSQEDFRAALEANKAGSSWKENKTYGDGVIEWVRQDNKSQAVRYPDGSFFLMEGELAQQIDKIESTTRGF